ncbi:MAG: UDP-glucose 4-epimerase GalE [Roseitalea sp.]|jgi:UDP-glucose 4-epimerase|nr:UDP-glucose 4-epimerase GalE [Roseitalea sp.]MBO6722411.1 UDP-glucose 4-epimerase GalE [Roseitalea sp.]MBO6741975.1 UDP-glucose 4-epimerase GalE [Roseitalea sp.]
MKILVTGGAGYIGSHTFLALREAGHRPVIFDNFSNASPRVLDRLGQLFQETVTCVEGDIRDVGALETTITEHGCEAVIHFAGYKAVGESMAEPLKYYDVNVGGTERLLTAMTNTGVRKMIFSSSATVYGDPQHLPIPEDHPLSTASVYGHTKLVVENMLRALHDADPRWAIAILRYFNPVGAHPSGLIGEDPADIPNNLMPYISQVAVGRRPHLTVFGDDYPTPDGTGVRDYIHVCDLAEGHVAALQLLDEPQCTAVNLGTGQGCSVLDMVRAFEAASGRPIPYKIAERRAGDIATCYADPARAKALMGWTAERDLADMCADAWRWQSRNPMGYLDIAAE